MPKYFLVDDNNAILQEREFVSEPTNLSGKPWRWLLKEVVSLPWNPATHRVSGKSYDVMATKVKVSEVMTELTPDEKSAYVDQERMAGYGPIGAQLDMLYWDSVNGTKNWKQHIAAVKAANPRGVV